MSRQTIQRIAAVVIGFCLMGCAMQVKKHLFDCKRSPDHILCK